ncbi:MULTISPECIES: acyltransferase [unclassified Novosphingobium]|uniref:acyltransferase family protein n=1 Tax=unclassified Novosphingobium TaxID=2644732 RepID=UPI00145B9618|nr:MULTISPECIES: acyltransferase [unclassified Novosphingobium]MBB3360517.1 peptidoglycan/LPS O-acetylase OafA/YrhL [Novosphingobium sp. BK256]MBB3376899.1 peptidoglycan/LPS O-acetylase OafA/YrhL [Novosphingobium sp. BK280]MBB3381269.1 peptidoglycan/LPS O-acetylase OafA/YrhL [Novosphingobium sp. BK258]MBB3422961.1 peptidoglycan/LPS O-acetylase OafA/YrhL [Novosphingobium sp. BK267]MBB3451663.1 peptidoglycan/LPS O-acetylase OafA/YrhL [Novosphingobium sp. BK352]
MDYVKTKVGSRLSAALDVSRSFAATYVVIHHVANANNWSHGLGVAFRFGQEAVIIFFLLSGFVIFANEHGRAKNHKNYYLRRLRRIYPPLIAAMAVSALVAFDNGSLKDQFKLGELIATLASLQDISLLKPGVISDPFLGNDPLWSLSYEVLFYLAFPLALRFWLVNKRHATAIIGIVCCAAYAMFAFYPNHFLLVAAYFLVWWCGAMAADAYFRGATNFLAFSQPLTWLGMLCVVAAIVVKWVGYHGLGYFPFLPLRHFAVSLALLLLLSNRIGIYIARCCQPLARPAAFWASISYGLYVMHYPILVDWHRVQSPAGMALGVLILIASAYLADRKLNLVLPRAPRD